MQTPILITLCLNNLTHNLVKIHFFYRKVKEVNIILRNIYYKLRENKIPKQLNEFVFEFHQKKSKVKF